MRKRPLYKIQLCLGLLAILVLLWYFCGYMLERSQKKTWSDFNNKVQIIHPVTGIPYASLINEYSVKAGLNPQLVAAIIKAESSFRPNAVSPSKAYGLMQVLPDTWQQVNHEVQACKQKHAGPCSVACFTDPELNLYIGTTYFSGLLKQYKGNVVLALAAYNAGPQSVNKYQTVPPFEETQEYINRIINYWYAFAGEQPLRPIDSKHWLRVQSYLGICIVLIVMVTVLIIWQMFAPRRRRWR